MVASHRAVLALASLLAFAPMQGCAAGASPDAGSGARPVLELAAALDGGQHQAGLVRVLRDTNGGRTAVPHRVADELLDADGVAGRIVAGTDDGVDEACAAFAHGRVVLDVGGSAAQHLLTDMWAELSAGRVESDTISLACTIHAVLAGS